MATTEFDMVSMPKSALDAILEDAAERGARKALASVGLNDERAPEHIRGLRDLFAMYLVVRNSVLKQIGTAIALVIMGGLVVAAAGYFGNIIKR
jgi:hypothetical protein